ncbi:LCP family protein [Janibacter cremeus]|uniref:LCP family protein required for cell wall assembly n=1 Tax=Janibacter cremeus TaxID=1285192 RepID=A0A852VTG6_9MICO|nr:LCP family protein [Janibacter cremeus]NYF97953.1 LCP family protein required for cell wall assembly [Janibacter cremeus]
MLEDFDDAADTSHAPRRRRRRMGRAGRVGVTLIALVVLLCVGVGGYGWFISSKVDHGLTHEKLLGDSKDDTTTTKGKDLVDDAGENYLIIGSDARPGETSSRADVIQLVHVDEDHENVWIIHFPRDLYVPIPGHGEDKINAAYAFGQAPLLVRTVQDLVGVKINHVAKTDFEGFKQLTDALGGVTVDNPQPGPDYPAGEVALDGTQALDFVRERKQLKEGDISRGQRQQAWLKAIMRETLDPQVLLNPSRLNDVIEAGTEHTVVDDELTGGVIRSEAIKMRSVRGDNIRFITAPFSGYGTTAEGASIDILDEQGMAALSDALRTDDLAGYAESAE